MEKTIKRREERMNSDWEVSREQTTKIQWKGSGVSNVVLGNYVRKNPDRMTEKNVNGVH